MTRTYDGIITATHNNLRMQHSDEIASLEQFISIAQQMVEYVSLLSPEASDLSSRSIEYHSFGVPGWRNGDYLAPMIWSIGHLSKFFAQMIQANTGLVMTSFFEPILAAEYLETVYVANSTSHQIYNTVVGGEIIDNIVNLSWVDLTSSIPTIDFAHIGIFNLADSRVCQTIVNAIRPGGLLILANSSNGGELYNLSVPITYPQVLHDEIHSYGEFTSFHLQGYISYTVFIKH